MTPCQVELARYTWLPGTCIPIRQLRKHLSNEDFARFNRWKRAQKTKAQNQSEKRGRGRPKKTANKTTNKVSSANTDNKGSLRKEKGKPKVKEQSSAKKVKPKSFPLSISSSASNFKSAEFIDSGGSSEDEVVDNSNVASVLPKPASIPPSGKPLLTFGSSESESINSSCSDSELDALRETDTGKNLPASKADRTKTGNISKHKKKPDSIKGESLLKLKDKPERVKDNTSKNKDKIGKNKYAEKGNLTLTERKDTSKCKTLTNKPSKMNHADSTKKSSFDQDQIKTEKPSSKKVKEKVHENAATVTSKKRQRLLSDNSRSSEDSSFIADSKNSNVGTKAKHIANKTIIMKDDTLLTPHLPDSSQAKKKARNEASVQSSTKKESLAKSKTGKSSQVSKESSVSNEVSTAPTEIGSDPSQCQSPVKQGSPAAAATTESDHQNKDEAPVKETSHIEPNKIGDGHQSLDIKGSVTAEEKSLGEQAQDQSLDKESSAESSDRLEARSSQSDTSEKSEHKLIAPVDETDTAIGLVSNLHQTDTLEKKVIVAENLSSTVPKIVPDKVSKDSQKASQARENTADSIIISPYESKVQSKLSSSLSALVGKYCKRCYVHVIDCIKYPNVQQKMIRDRELSKGVKERDQNRLGGDDDRRSEKERKDKKKKEKREREVYEKDEGIVSKKKRLDSDEVDEMNVSDF